MILLVNGPNLNLLGEDAAEGDDARETLADVERMVQEACAGYGLAVKALQSNSEGALLDFLQAHRRDAEGVIVNPGPLASTSVALAECLRALACPAIEVQLSNAPAEDGRASLIATAVVGRIVGLGVSGYHYAALHLCALATARAVTLVRDEAQAAAGPVPSPREQLRWAQEQMRARRTPASPPAAAPAPPAGSVPPSADGLRIPEEGEPIPVDVNARGDYEPL